jgi:hypothetical protein
MNYDCKPRLDVEAEQALLNYLMIYRLCKTHQERFEIQQTILKLEAWIQELNSDCCGCGSDCCNCNMYDIEEIFGFPY